MNWLLLCLMLFQADTIEEARQRLKELEAKRAEAAAIQAAVEKKAAEELAAKLQAEQEAAKEPDPDPELESEPDVPVLEQQPLRLVPKIRFEQLVSASVDERRPRLLELSAKWCSYCVKMQQESPDLFGDSSSPIEIVDVDDPGFRAKMDAYGLVGWAPKNIPILFCVQADGTLMKNENGTFRMWPNYKSPAQVAAIMNECGVSVDAADSNVRVVANVEDMDLSPDGFAGVLAAHLIEQAAAETDEDPDRALYGGLFSFDVDVPDRVKSLAAKVLAQQTIEFPAAGCTLDWSGPKRSVSFSAGRIEISPAVKVKVKKWMLTYSAGLSAVSYEEDLSSVVIELQGAPDLEVRLK